jgi:hypothetical protein
MTPFLVTFKLYINKCKVTIFSVISCHCVTKMKRSQRSNYHTHTDASKKCIELYIFKEDHIKNTPAAQALLAAREVKNVCFMSLSPHKSGNVKAVLK